MSDDKDNKHTPSCLSMNVLLGIDDKNDVSKYQIVLDEVDIGFSPHPHHYHDVTFSLDKVQTPLHHEYQTAGTISSNSSVSFSSAAF